MSSEFRLMETDMLYEICKFLSDNKKNKDKKYFVDPYAINSDFEDISIRDKCFTYKSLFFSKMIDGNIKEMCIIDVPQFPNELKVLNINYLSSLNDDIIGLINFSMNSCKDMFDKFKSISINHDSLKGVSIDNIINELGFNRSIFLENEFGIDRNLVIYTKTL